MEIQQLDDKDVPAFQTGDDWSIESVFSAGDSYLFFLTLDIPHEETLKIILFDRGGSQLESVELSAAYTPGLFKFNKSDSNKIYFDFWPDAELILELKDKPVYPWQAIKISNATHSGSFFKKRRLVLGYTKG